MQAKRRGLQGQGGIDLDGCADTTGAAQAGTRETRGPIRQVGYSPVRSLVRVSVREIIGTPRANSIRLPYGQAGSVVGMQPGPKP